MTSKFDFRGQASQYFAHCSLTTESPHSLLNMPPHPVDSGAFTKSSHEQIPPKVQIGPLGSSSSQPVGQSSQYRAHISFTGKSPISLENTPPHPVLSGCSTKSLQLQSPPNRHAGLVGRASRHAKASAITSVEGGVGRRFTLQMLSLQTLTERSYFGLRCLHQQYHRHRPRIWPSKDFGINCGGARCHSPAVFQRISFAAHCSGSIAPSGGGGIHVLDLVGVPFCTMHVHTLVVVSPCDSTFLLQFGPGPPSWRLRHRPSRARCIAREQVPL